MPTYPLQAAVAVVECTARAPTSAAVPNLVRPCMIPPFFGLMGTLSASAHANTRGAGDKHGNYLARNRHLWIGNWRQLRLDVGARITGSGARAQIAQSADDVSGQIADRRIRIVGQGLGQADVPLIAAVSQR